MGIFLIPLILALTSIIPSVMIFPINDSCQEFMQQCLAEGNACTCTLNGILSSILPLGIFFGTMIFMQAREKKKEESQVEK